MMRRIVALVTPFVISLGLTGCPNAQLATFTAADLNQAASIADLPNEPAVPAAANTLDPQGYSCFGTMAPVVAALAAGKSTGLFTTIEVARVVIISAKSGEACQMIAQPILEAIAALPGGGNILAEAAVAVQ
jgi:hypothetical protein